MISILILIGFITLYIWGDWQSKRWLKAGKSPGLFYSIWKNIAWNFRGWHLLFFIISITLTIMMAATNLDYNIQVFFQSKNPLGQSFPWFVLMAGNFWPIGLALIPYFWGKIKKNRKSMIAGLAALQALFLNSLINTSEKVISGRQGPGNLVGSMGQEHHHFAHTSDPLNFRFDFWNHTLKDGRFMWPSGHTASMFALVTALVVYYPEKKWLAWIGYPASVITGIAMIDGDFHWTSDVVAGAILGIIAGRVTGRSFKSYFQQNK